MEFHLYTCRHCSFEAYYLDAMLKHQAEHHPKPVTPNRVGQAGPKAIACTVGLGACNFLAATPLGGPDEQIERAFGAMQVRRVSDGE